MHKLSKQMGAKCPVLTDPPAHRHQMVVYIFADVSEDIARWLIVMNKMEDKNEINKKSNILCSAPIDVLILSVFHKTGECIWRCAQSF